MTGGIHGDYALHSIYFVCINIQNFRANEFMLQPLCIDVKDRC